MKTRARITWIAGAAAVSLMALSAAVYYGAREQMIPPELDFLYSLARQRYDIVASLTSPVGVKGWTEGGLVLTDGQVVPLPGIRRLPLSSAALEEATRRGVEVRADGRIFGLVRVWHWCGNDPVREHVVRVDLARLLIFLDEGEHVEVKSPPCVYACESLGGRFGKYGWDPSEYGMFKEWDEALDSPLGRQAT